MLTLLFDLDGTLVDTDPLHFRAHAMLLAENGLPEIDLNFYRTHIMGFGMAEMSALYAQWIPGGNEARYRAMADRKEALFRELISEVEPARGVVHLLDWAGEKGVPCGVVTN
ncbi:MAG TPA: HAD hydrolase-like protein, partial [Polyangiaceae bacterium]|nr:HAD hydrolase-like protein [Polyangiaceae bacterium]